MKVAHFLNKHYGDYFFTDGREKLLVRMKNAKDLAIHSGNTEIAHKLLDLYSITGDKKWKHQEEEILKEFAVAIE